MLFPLFYRDRPKAHVTVSDLPWESREAVLRALFVKMNSGTLSYTKNQGAVRASNSVYHENDYLPMSQGMADQIRSVSEPALFR